MIGKMVSEGGGEDMYDISRTGGELVVVMKRRVYEGDWSFVVVEAV
ncbi:hypothetical protein [Bacillus pumilus]|nr:hypothetical protein [Bacillus pumilus]